MNEPPEAHTKQESNFRSQKPIHKNRISFQSLNHFFFPDSFTFNVLGSQQILRSVSLTVVHFPLTKDGIKQSGKIQGQGEAVTSSLQAHVYRTKNNHK